MNITAMRFVEPTLQCKGFRSQAISDRVLHSETVAAVISPCIVLLEMEPTRKGEGQEHENLHCNRFVACGRTDRADESGLVIEFTQLPC